MGVHLWPDRGPPRAPDGPVWIPRGLLVLSRGVPFIPLVTNHALPICFPPGMLAEAANSAQM